MNQGNEPQQITTLMVIDGAAAAYAGPDRRTDARDEWRDYVNQRLADGTARMGRIEATQVRVEAKQDANNADTAEMLEIIRMGKGFFRGVAACGKWFRKVIMWTLPLATAILAFWYTLTGHGPTK